MYGSDAKNAAEPDEFTEMVQGIRAIETMLASPVDKNNLDPYQVMKETFEKSLVSLVSHPQRNCRYPGNDWGKETRYWYPCGVLG